MRMKLLRLKRWRVDTATEEEGQGLLLQQQQQQQQQQRPCVDGDDNGEEHSLTSSLETVVVILKASIHCHGCGRRVKKAILKLEGVDTFHVDVKEQKVTVMGRICPFAAMECVKKVIKESVEFWESPSAKMQ